VETFAYVLRYSFVAALAVEFILIGRAFIGMVREKARAAAPPAAEE
jgi:hypothetical protein